jgi:hypothetical protein
VRTTAPREESLVRTLKVVSKRLASIAAAACMLGIGCTPAHHTASGRADASAGSACSVPLRTVEEAASQGQVIVFVINDNPYTVIANYLIEERDTNGALIKTCQGPAPLSANRKQRACVYSKPHHAIVDSLSCTH